MSRAILMGVVVGLVLGLGLLSGAFLRDMDRARDRVSKGSALVSSPYGNIEYAEGGAGPSVLVVHGSGGGFDQGELIARTVLGGQFHWIAPSRFGYLRSSLPESASFDDQADAYAYLLDQLGVDRVAVVAMSHGGPSALLFAVRHPERVSSLTLLSCGVASTSAAAQAQASRQGNMLAWVFQHDFAYWGMTKVFRKTFLGLIGATGTVVASLTPDQREMVDAFVDGMNPASLRSAGALFDNKAAMPNERIAAISAPTLVVHAVDDTLQIFRNAEFAAATIPSVDLLRFETGGHVLAIVEQALVSKAVQEHIQRHLSP
ncbi:MAG: alpha/beta hydrolase [Candidatus Bipolaricaulis sp.]|nr:alpha/beta hydrolase [Candidatus Bipolaricaulis sp.]